MRDVKAEDTIYIAFTTRAFATGIPTVLSGSPAVSAYEDGGLTQITAGITLGVDHDSVVGLNMLTIVATAANGYDTGKDYNLVITTGTVGGVSVVGEVVGQFSIDRSSARQRIDEKIGSVVDLGSGTSTVAANLSDLAGATYSNTTDSQEAIRDALATVDTVVDGIQTDLDNGTDGLGALKTLIDALNDLSAAQVNAEVVDALATDTYAEPAQGTPAATATLAAKVNYIYKAWRNRHTQTASQYSLYNDDATTIDHKATFSDDATTADRGEVATGP